MSEHICTTKSLTQGGIEIERECLVCLNITKHTDGYTGSYCQACDTLISGEEFRGDIAKMQRSYLGMTRKQLGFELGYKSMTVRFYENQKCSKNYWNKLQKFVKKYN